MMYKLSLIPTASSVTRNSSNSTEYINYYYLCEDCVRRYELHKHLSIVTWGIEHYPTFFIVLEKHILPIRTACVGKDCESSKSPQYIIRERND